MHKIKTIKWQKNQKEMAKNLKKIHKYFVKLKKKGRKIEIEILKNLKK